MIVFPHAKINLGLNVVRRRDDGYHDIRTNMVPIPLHDALEVIIAPDLPQGRIEFTRSGLEIPGQLEEDLCWKAARSLSDSRELPGMRMHLHKNIPMGAGLGGGSSDGAHTLLLLNELFALGMTQPELRDRAGTLGSDCPFFIDKRIQFATGTGGSLTPLELDLSGHWLLLIHPNEHVGTAEVYRNCRPSGKEVDILHIVCTRPVRAWQEILVNDLQDHVVATYPKVAMALDLVLQAGATYAAMSGSGSAVYGLFDVPPEIPDLPEGYGAWSFRL